MSVLEQVHTQATRTSVADITQTLQALLGQRTVAFACGVRSPKSVGHWAQGTRPAPEAVNRLRSLYQAALVLKDESDETKQAWLVGSNPGLDDHSPIEMIREGYGRDVIRAAEAFVNNS